jgi:molybdopterin-guanine dinucleotide biosynthesis protein A
MDVVIIAGGIPQPGEPLFEYTRGTPKALLDIAGKPMAQWVLDALSDAEKVDSIVAVGLPEDSILRCKKPVIYITNQIGLLENIRAGMYKILEINPGGGRVLTASSDIPSITPEMVDWAISTAEETDHDIYYNVIKREVMERRFPGSNRSYVHLRDMEVCGGDMNVVHSSIVTGNDELWQRIVAARKSALKQASLLGIDTLILLLLRIFSLQGAQKRVSKRLGLRGRAIVCPYAEIGMDVDKPHQLEILRKDLSR